MTSSGPTHVEHRIPRHTIRRTRIVGAGDQESAAATVYCPVQERSCAVRECEGCRRFHALHFEASTRTTSVACHTEQVAPPSPAREAALRNAAGGPSDLSTPIADVMTRDVVCVRAEVGLDEVVVLLLRHGISGLPVVDAEGTPVGMVSRADVMRAAQEQGDTEETARVTARPRDLAPPELEPGFHVHESVPVTVRDMMSSPVLTLHERASLGQAAALMAYEGVHRLPVVSDDGKVVGILSSLDILGWFGRRCGYLIPAGPYKCS